MLTRHNARWSLYLSTLVWGIYVAAMGLDIYQSVYIMTQNPWFDESMIWGILLFLGIYNQIYRYPVPTVIKCTMSMISHLSVIIWHWLFKVLNSHFLIVSKPTFTCLPFIMFIWFWNLRTVKEADSGPVAVWYLCLHGIAWMQSHTSSVFWFGIVFQIWRPAVDPAVDLVLQKLKQREKPEFK